MKALFIIPGLLVTCLAASASAESSGQALPRETTHYSHAQLKQLKRDASTPRQYQMLAQYFEQRKQSFAEQADSEKKEWDRRSTNIVGLGAKYPRPVDSARNLYQYYAYEADQAEQLQAQYQRLAHSAEVATSSAASNR